MPNTKRDAALTFRYYVEVCSLPPEHRPAHVLRHRGATVLLVDWRSTREEVACWIPDNLTPQEQNAGRDAYGEPPVGAPLDDRWMGDSPFPPVVPDPVRLPRATEEVRRRSAALRESAQRTRLVSAALRAQSTSCREERRG